MIPALITLAIWFAYFCGRLEVKLNLKKAVYKKHSDILQHDPKLDSDYNRGVCDGLEHLMMEVTDEPLTYWRL